MKMKTIGSERQPRRVDVAKLQNSMLSGEDARIVDFFFSKHTAKQTWRVEHTSGMISHSPHSLVEAFFKCRAKVTAAR